MTAVPLAERIIEKALDQRCHRHRYGVGEVRRSSEMNREAGVELSLPDARWLGDARRRVIDYSYLSHAALLTQHELITSL